MNWYKVIIAGNREDYLRSIGASEDIVQYITSLDENSAQLLTNEFRKNPQMTINDIQQFAFPKQHVTPDINKQIEAALMEKFPETMQPWVLKQTRKMWRYMQVSGEEPQTHANDYVPFVRSAVWGGNKFGQKLSEIKDWVTRSGIKIDISSYSYDQAVEASDEWHEFMASQGEGGTYEPTQKINILYGPTWTDKKSGKEIEEYKGWTIQNVTSENDLIVEGNKCSHCVGSYFNEVERGDLSIVSLRDPHNGPHVTMELTGDKVYPDTVVQIQGKSNSTPKPKYQEMIKHWIQNDSSAPKYMGDEDYASRELDNIFGRYSSGHIPERFEDLVYVDGEYGLSNHPWDYYELEQAYNGIVEYLSKYDRGYGYSGDGGMGEDLVYAAINLMSPEKDGIEILTELIQKTEEDADEYFIDMDIGIPYPQEEDFETGEEYDEAMDKYYDVQNSHKNDTMPYGFTYGLYDEIKSGLQKYKDMTLEEWWKIQQEKSKQQMVTV